MLAIWSHTQGAGGQCYLSFGLLVLTPLLKVFLCSLQFICLFAVNSDVLLRKRVRQQFGDLKHTAKASNANPAFFLSCVLLFSRCCAF